MEVQQMKVVLLSLWMKRYLLMLSTFASKYKCYRDGCIEYCLILKWSIPSCKFIQGDPRIQTYLFFLILGQEFILYVRSDIFWFCHSHCFSKTIFPRLFNSSSCNLRSRKVFIHLLSLEGLNSHLRLECEPLGLGDITFTCVFFDILGNLPVDKFFAKRDFQSCGTLLILLNSLCFTVKYYAHRVNMNFKHLTMVNYMHSHPGAGRYLSSYKLMFSNLTSN